MLVLGRGEVAKEFGDSEHWFRLHVTYLRDHDPAELLGSPSLAPLAALGRADSREHRTTILRRAREVIHLREPDRHRRQALLDTTESLARIYLDRLTIAAAEKEDSMPIDIDPETAQWAREPTEESERRWRPVVEALRPTTQAVLTVLRHRFGDQNLIDLLAWRMTVADPVSAVQRALEAPGLEALMASYLALDGS